MAPVRKTRSSTFGTPTSKGKTGKAAFKSLRSRGTPSKPKAKTRASRGRPTKGNASPVNIPKVTETSTENISDDEGEEEAEVEAEVVDNDIEVDAVLEEEKPTEKQWKAMKPYNALEIAGSDPNGPGHQFKVDDIVLVVPKDIRHHSAAKPSDILNLWVARITNIRSMPENGTWCKIRWFYNKRHFAEAKRTSSRKIPFDPNTCGKYELIETDHEDFMSVDCIDDWANVTYFVEDSLQQSQIDELYIRTKFFFKSHKLETQRPTCRTERTLCRKPYNPDSDVQYFCPTCQRWYHDECLENAKWALTPAVIRRLPEEPQLLITDSLPPAALAGANTNSGDRAASSSPRRSSRHNRPSISQVSPKASLGSGHRSRPKIGTPTSLVAFKRKGVGSIEIPKTLRDIAQQQIARGGGERYGVVGNAKAVCLARQFIADLLSDAKSLDDDNWKREVGTKYVATFESPAASPSKKSAPRYYMCGNCQNLM